VIDMSNVVLFPTPDLSTFDAAWSIVPPTMRRRSKRLAALREAWDRHARTFGQEALLGSLRAYVADKDFERHGGQALDRWLAGGRYEHFAPLAPPPVIDQFCDAMTRRVVCQRLGEEWAQRYLDPCTKDGTTLIARTSIAVERLMVERELLKSLGYSGIRKRCVDD